MTGFLIGLFTFIAIVVSCFLILVVLMQRPSANAGMGSALGSGAAESAFGAQSGNVLTRWSIYAVVALFVICFGLYLTYMDTLETRKAEGGLPQIRMEEADSRSPDYAPGSLTEVPVEQ